MSSELNIQVIAEEVIGRLQRQSHNYAGVAERAKHMAEGARELYDAIRREAELLSTGEAAGEAERLQTGEASTQGESDAD